MAQRSDQPEPIRVNRAPVLTLWAAIAAEYLLIPGDDGPAVWR